MDAWGNYTPTNGNGIGKGYDEKGSSEKGYGQKGYGKKEGKEKGWKGPKLPDIKYDGKELPGRVKVDYRPLPDIENWDDKQIDLQRTKYRIDVQVSEGEFYNVAAPVTDLSLMPKGIREPIARDMNIRKPTPIQMQVWPAAMSGRDIIGVAPTGSGKTLAYMLPMFEHCQAQPKMTATGPIALILVPNGDLAKQIWWTFDRCRNARRELKMALAVPGENLPRNDERYHILVASPGKLHELIRNLNQDTTQFFKYTTYLVVDEADHLLREEKDGADLTLQILRQLRPDIQMLYFTATWDESLPREIGKVFNRSNYESREPLLEVIVNGKTLSACSNVQQCFLRRTNGEPDRDAVGEEREESRALNQYWLEEDTKEGALYRLVYWTVKNAEKSDPGNSKILVFTNSKERVGELYEIISQNEIPVLKLTGETHTRERNNIVQSFADPNKTDYLILITTDMLGRGIDFTTCRYVIVYDFPHHRNSVREYVHRIGRTGRAGRQGFAITLLDEKQGDFRYCPEIVKVLEASGQTPRQWMRDESSGRKQKIHRDIYWSLRNQRPEEPLTPRAAETSPTPPMAPDPAPMAPNPAASAPMENLPDVGHWAEGRVQREYKYGSVLADVNIPCSPMYDLEGFCKDNRVPITGKMDKERRFPIVF